MSEFGNVDPEDFDQRNQKALDEKLLVKFELRPRQDKEASQKEGRPVFRDVEYVDIRVPGQKEGVCRPARPSDIARFPRHYRAFKERITAPEVGTPLSEWPVISRSMVETLSFHNVKTVEHLANMNDGDALGISGAVSLRDKAKEYLEFAKDLKKSTDAEKLAKENEELKETVKTLTDSLEELKEKVASLKDDVPEKPSEKKEVKSKTKKSASKKKNPLAG